MKIYTKTGDDGTTGLFAGPRVFKDDPRITAYGSVDELNAILGMVVVRAQPSSGQMKSEPLALASDPEIGQNAASAPEASAFGLQAAPSASGLPSAQSFPSDEPSIAGILQHIQHDLFAIGAELATPQPALHGTRLVEERHIARLESWIDTLESSLQPLSNFIVPGGTELAALLHWARTVCRRAERDVVHFLRQTGQADGNRLLIYLNRTSDLLFVLSRCANSRAGVADVPWNKNN